VKLWAHAPVVAAAAMVHPTPAGFEVTVPFPVPAPLMVSARITGAKLALTVRATSIVS
jgi:hypothetical protein